MAAKLIYFAFSDIISVSESLVLDRYAQKHEGHLSQQGFCQCRRSRAGFQQQAPNGYTMALSGARPASRLAWHLPMPLGWPRDYLDCPGWPATFWTCSGVEIQGL